MISRRAYYFLILLLPFTVRLAIMGRDMFFITKDDTLWFPAILMPSYALFVGWCWYRFRRMDTESIRSRFTLLPLYFYAMLLVTYPVTSLIYEIACGTFEWATFTLPAFGSVLLLMLMASPFALLYCWTYVWVAFILERIFIVCKIIKP